MSALANKQAVHRFSRDLRHPGWDRWQVAVNTLFHPDAEVHVVHPFNDVGGPSGMMDHFLDPLRTAFDGLHRRDDILIGATHGGQDWVSVHGKYVGHFGRDWLGIPATGRLEYLRFGEFYRFEDGKVVAAHIFLDIPHLMIAAECWPIKDSPGRNRGYTGFLPGPATQDGIVLHDTAQPDTDKTLDMIENMLRSLASDDEAWRPYWHDNMMWYGPAAFGAFCGIEEFAGFQVPFEGAFKLWTGGLSGNGVTEHFARFADGDYACIGGWPSLMCVRKDRFLDQPSQGETLYMRVCDWWRREGDKLVENWVLVDIPDVLLQMGVDLFKGHHNETAGPRT